MFNKNGRRYLPSIYDPFQALEIFGQTPPSVAERTLYFEASWGEWEKNEATLAGVARATLLKEFGALNFVTRGNKIRFRKTEHLMMYLLIAN